MDKTYLLSSSAFHKSCLGDGQRWLWKGATAFKISTEKVLVVLQKSKNVPLWYLLFWNSLGCFLEESSMLLTLCHKLSRMIGNTGRYFILQRISLWSECCVLNCESELFRETLRKQWLHLENMIASSVLIFMLFEAIFIFVFVCSWWKRWKDLRTSWIPLRE